MMNEIIKKLLRVYGYVEKSSGVEFFSKGDSAYFLLLNLSESELTQITKKQLLNDNQTYNSIVDGFNKMLDVENKIAIEKNSSLIVLVECSTLESITNLQQQILLFEEDEFFFKKYVLMYTPDSISDLINKTEEELLPILKDKLYNSENFEQFANEGFKTTLSEYLIVLQLFIKLPFLNLDFENQDFKTLDEKLSEELANDKLLYQSLLENKVRIESIDFSDPQQEEQINELLSILPHD